MKYSNYPEIKTARGVLVVSKNGTAELTWNKDFVPKWEKKFSLVQKYVDSEVYRYCEPYTPKRTGMLVMSGELGTVFGQGYVEWLAPYAAYQYYMPNRIGSETGALRGPFWFERMKEVHLKSIYAGALKIVESG